MDEEIALRIDLQYDALLIRLLRFCFAKYIRFAGVKSTFPAGEGLGLSRLLGL